MEGIVVQEYRPGAPLDASLMDGTILKLRSEYKGASTWSSLEQLAKEKIKI